MTEQFSSIFLQQVCDKLDEPRVIIKAQSPRFEIVAYNNQFVQISRTQGRELIGESMAEIHVWNHVNEEGALQIYDAMTKAIQTKAIVRLPAVRYDLTTENATVIPCWWQAVYEPLLNSKGTVEYLLCTTHNITALVENGHLGTTKNEFGFVTNN